MRLLPKELECPVDNLLIECCQQVAPYFYETGHTANMITFEGTIIYLYALKMLIQGKLREFAVLYGIGYFFDCLDGYFARRYKMVSKFGEWFEHIRDVLVAIAYFFILFKYFKVTNEIIILFLVAGYGLLTHLGHQQIYLDGKNGFLDSLKPFANNAFNMTETRWFGCGTFNLIIIFAPFFLERIYQNSIINF
jgi:phosphatidylglycerophosphate synthase